MRNRAKCKLCSDILESFHEHDWVSCKCGEISICGGNVKLECSAKDWKSFLRVDDQGNVIVPKVMQKDEVEAIVEPKALSKAEKIAKARGLAWLAAKQLSGGDVGTTAAVMRSAEMDVLRKIAADYLDDGEEGYWMMVKREIVP